MWVITKIISDEERYLRRDDITRYTYRLDQAKRFPSASIAQEFATANRIHESARIVWRGAQAHPLRELRQA